MTAPILTLLEGKWFPGRHISVRDLFEPVVMWTPDNNYHYEQFTNEKAFCDAIKYAFRTHRAKTIYIGAHGNSTGISGFHDEGISRIVIRNALRSVQGQTKRGLYFGSCSFVTDDTAEMILKDCPRVQWVAGYSSNVDWVDSSVLDMFFFRHFLLPNPGRGKSMPRTNVQRLQYASRVTRRDMMPLASRLDFRVFVRNKKRFKNLMQEDDG